MAKDPAPADVSSNSGRTDLIELVESIERLEDDKAGVASDIADKYSEAKGRGFNTRALRRLVADRAKERKNAEKKRTDDDDFELYKECFG